MELSPFHPTQMGRFAEYSSPRACRCAISANIRVQTGRGELSKSTTPKAPAREIGPWHAARDVLIAAINKGQLIPVIGGAALLLILVRMPAADVGIIAKEFLQGLKDGSLLGYFLFL